MYKGEVIAHGDPGELLQQPHLIERADLELPWLIEMHSDFVKKGWVPPSTSLPKTKEDLLRSVPTKSDLQSA
ncbi:MAG TPA: hypothetical protein VN456_02265 [Desulfosporosinus sp.]|nr:hypothetical protein [Desulfosporosinus sp.]